MLANLRIRNPDASEKITIKYSVTARLRMRENYTRLDGPVQFSPYSVSVTILDQKKKKFCQ